MLSIPCPYINNMYINTLTLHIQILLCQNHCAAEIMGKGVGTNNGKGGSMHIVDPELGLIMSTGIVGSGIPDPPTRL